MSLFKKLLGKSVEAEVKERATQPTQKKFQARAERVPLKTNHEIQCESQSPGVTLTPGAILNISLTGIGFSRPNFNRLPEPGAILKIRLKVAESIFDADLKIVYATDFVVGACFVNSSFELATALKHYFRGEIAALRVAPVSSNLMKAPPRGQAYWFEGDANNSFYYVEEAGKVLSFSIFVLGNVIEYSEQGNLRFGQRRHDVDARMHESGTSNSWDSVWPRDMIDLTRRFIDAVPKLSPHVREFVLSKIVNIPTK